MRAIFLKELRDSRGLLLVLIAVMCALHALPRDLCRTWTGFSIFFIVPMLCCYLGARLLTSETEDEQLTLLLMIPIPRWQLFAAKVGAGLAMTALVALVAVAGSMGGPGFRWEDDKIGFWAGTVALLYVLGAYFSLVWPKSQGASFSAFLAFALGATGYDSVERAINPGRDYSVMLAHILLCTALIGLACCWTFCRADLTDLSDRRRYAARSGLLAVVVAALTAYYLSSSR